MSKDKDQDSLSFAGVAAVAMTIPGSLQSEVLKEELTSDELMDNQDDRVNGFQIRS